MSRIELRGVGHRYGGDGTPWAVEPADLAWENGGSYALLGPSGCGKTTLLKIISGLLTPSRGTVLFDGKDVTAASPRERNIAQVFQFPVVYDTLTVGENLAFPLRNRGIADGDARVRVREVAELLELLPDLDHRASGLSADMKQRISLGRGLVRTDVAAILLDEPLTVIDPHVKWLLRRKLKQIHERLRVTLVYVTHDQTEALTLADRVVVMNEGRVVQQGSPQELFEEPAHAFVGWFIGSPGMNFLPCTVEGGAAIVEGRRIPLATETAARAAKMPAGAGAAASLKLGIRPELVRAAVAGAEGSVEALVERVDDLGGQALLTARIGAHPLKAKIEGGNTLPRVGDTVWLELPPEWTRLYAGVELLR